MKRKRVLHNTKTSDEKNIHAPAGFEHAISASEQLHTYALDWMTTEFGTHNDMVFVMNLSFCQSILTEIRQSVLCWCSISNRKPLTAFLRQF